MNITMHDVTAIAITGQTVPRATGSFRTIKISAMSDGKEIGITLFVDLDFDLASISKTEVAPSRMVLDVNRLVDEALAKKVPA